MLGWPNPFIVGGVKGLSWNRSSLSKLGHPDGLDDLENGRPDDDEKEESQQLRGDRVRILLSEKRNPHYLGPRTQPSHCYVARSASVLASESQENETKGNGQPNLTNPSVTRSSNESLQCYLRQTRIKKKIISGCYWTLLIPQINMKKLAEKIINLIWPVSRSTNMRVLLPWTLAHGWKIITHSHLIKLKSDYWG